MATSLHRATVILAYEWNDTERQKMLTLTNYYSEQTVLDAWTTARQIKCRAMKLHAINIAAFNCRRDEVSWNRHCWTYYRMALQESYGTFPYLC